MGATPSSSASQAEEWSGRGAVVGPDPGAVPSPPDEGRIPGSGAPKSKADKGGEMTYPGERRAVNLWQPQRHQTQENHPLSIGRRNQPRPPEGGTQDLDPRGCWEPRGRQCLGGGG